jgi:DNA-binding NarL/FixJ family response regulator
MDRKWPIRVGLADKNPLIQAALKHLLSEDKRFKLMHIASGCEDFLANIEAERIDVGIIGWVIGPCDGRFILDHVNKLENPPRIIVYTGDESKSVPSQVMIHGGAAFVSKSCLP